MPGMCDACGILSDQQWSQVMIDHRNDGRFVVFGGCFADGCNPFVSVNFYENLVAKWSMTVSSCDAHHVSVDVRNFHF